MAKYYVAGIPFDDKDCLKHYGVKGMKWDQHLFGVDANTKYLGDWFKKAGQNIGKFTTNAINGAGKAAQNAGKWVGSTARNVGNAVGTAANNVGNWAGQAGKDIGNAANQANKWAGTAVNNAANFVTGNKARDDLQKAKNSFFIGRGGRVNAAQKAYDQTLPGAVEKAANGAKGYINSAGKWVSTAANDAQKWANQAGQDITKTAGNVGNAIGEAANNVGNWVGDRAKDVGNAATNAWNGVTNAANDAGQWIGDRASDVGNWFTGGDKGQQAADLRDQARALQERGDAMVDQGVREISDSIYAEPPVNMSPDNSAYAQRAKDDSEAMFRKGLSTRNQGYDLQDDASELRNRAAHLQSSYDAAPGQQIRAGAEALGNAASNAVNWIGDRAQDVGRAIADPQINKIYSDWQHADSESREKIAKKYGLNSYEDVLSMDRSTAEAMLNELNKEYNTNRDEYERKLKNPLGSAIQDIFHSSVNEKPSGVSDAFWKNYLAHGGTREQYDKDWAHL